MRLERCWVGRSSARTRAVASSRRKRTNRTIRHRTVTAVRRLGTVRCSALPAGCTCTASTGNTGAPMSWPDPPGGAARSSSERSNPWWGSTRWLGAVASSNCMRSDPVPANSARRSRSREHTTGWISSTRHRRSDSFPRTRLHRSRSFPDHGSGSRKPSTVRGGSAWPDLTT